MYGILDVYDNFYSLYVVQTHFRVIKNLVLSIIEISGCNVLINTFTNQL